MISAGEFKKGGVTFEMVGSVFMIVEFTTCKTQETVSAFVRN